MVRTLRCATAPMTMGDVRVQDFGPLQKYQDILGLSGEAQDAIRDVAVPSKEFLDSDMCTRPRVDDGGLPCSDATSSPEAELSFFAERYSWPGHPDAAASAELHDSFAHGHNRPEAPRAHHPRDL